jgi:hypothetical protein
MSCYHPGVNVISFSAGGFIFAVIIFKVMDIIILVCRGCFHFLVWMFSFLKAWMLSFLSVEDKGCYNFTLCTLHVIILGCYNLCYHLVLSFILCCPLMLLFGVIIWCCHLVLSFILCYHLMLSLLTVCKCYNFCVIIFPCTGWVLSFMLSFNVIIFCYHFPPFFFFLKTWHTRFHGFKCTSLLRLMPVCVGLIMLAAYFLSFPLIKSGV